MTALRTDRIRFFFSDSRDAFDALAAMDSADLEAGRTSTEISVAVRQPIGAVLSVYDRDREEIFAVLLQSKFTGKYFAVGAGQMLVQFNEDIFLNDANLNVGSKRITAEYGTYVLEVIPNPRDEGGAHWLVLKGTKLGMTELAFRDYEGMGLDILLDYLGTRLPGHPYKVGDFALVRELESTFVFRLINVPPEDRTLVRVDSGRALVVGPLKDPNMGKYVDVPVNALAQVVAVLP